MLNIGKGAHIARAEREDCGGAWQQHRESSLPPAACKNPEFGGGLRLLGFHQLEINKGLWRAYIDKWALSIGSVIFTHASVCGVHTRSWHTPEETLFSPSRWPLGGRGRDDLITGCSAFGSSQKAAATVAMRAAIIRPVCACSVGCHCAVEGSCCSLRHVTNDLISDKEVSFASRKLLLSVGLFASSSSMKRHLGHSHWRGNVNVI